MFSCDANNFELSHSQRRVIQTMNRFINENIKPGKPIQASSTLPKTNKTKSITKITLNDWIKTGTNTNAIQLIRHLLTNDTRMNRINTFVLIFIFIFNKAPSDELLNRLKSRQKRWHKKLLKLKTQNKLSLETGLLK